MRTVLFAALAPFLFACASAGQWQPFAVRCTVARMEIVQPPHAEGELQDADRHVVFLECGEVDFKAEVAPQDYKDLREGQCVDVAGEARGKRTRAAMFTTPCRDRYHKRGAET